MPIMCPGEEALLEVPVPCRSQFKEEATRDNLPKVITSISPFSCHVLLGAGQLVSLSGVLPPPVPQNLV